MALSDMVVFNQYVREATIETVAQMVAKFNEASAGAIQLSTEGFGGDYLLKSMFSSLHSAQRRVDRHATNTSASETAPGHACGTAPAAPRGGQARSRSPWHRRIPR